jgi:hypothetical protein
MELVLKIPKAEKSTFRRRSKGNAASEYVSYFDTALNKI